MPTVSFGKNGTLMGGKTKSGGTKGKNDTNRFTLQLANLGPKMMNSTKLDLVTSLKMMIVVGVLNFAVPQSTPPRENLGIPRFFGCQDPVCRVDESLT